MGRRKLHCSAGVRRSMRRLPSARLTSKFNTTHSSVSHCTSRVPIELDYSNDDVAVRVAHPEVRVVQGKGSPVALITVPKNLWPVHDPCQAAHHLTGQSSRVCIQYVGLQISNFNHIQDMPPTEIQEAGCREYKCSHTPDVWRQPTTQDE
ncbi:hypothetical protein ANO11243_092910 [Dothideomycetidae sp. 11243]|nr:hypothetical protein ANO11243_092910 [fungal sp. No.11243]